MLVHTLEEVIWLSDWVMGTVTTRLRELNKLRQEDPSERSHGSNQ